MKKIKNKKIKNKKIKKKLRVRELNPGLKRDRLEY